jgi:RNA polymerase sigma factor (sigma-70 family)
MTTSTCARGGAAPEPGTATPSEYLQALVAGDRDTWRNCVATYQGIVRAAARRHGLSPQEAEDAGQRVWLQLFRNAARIHDPVRLPGWIATTARRECLAIACATNRYSTGELPVELPAAGPGPDEEVVVRDSAVAMLRAIDRLPPRQRSLMRQLATDDSSYAEIGRRLDMPIGSIGPIRARAISRLRVLLAAPGPATPAGRVLRGG